MLSKLLPHVTLSLYCAQCEFSHLSVPWLQAENGRDEAQRSLEAEKVRADQVRLPFTPAICGLVMYLRVIAVDPMLWEPNQALVVSATLLV